MTEGQVVRGEMAEVVIHLPKPIAETRRPSFPIRRLESSVIFRRLVRRFQERRIHQDGFRKTPQIE